VKIALWSVFFLVPVGRADSLPRLNALQCEEAFSRLWQQSRIRSDAIKTTEAPHYRRFVLEQLSCGNTDGALSEELRSQASRWARCGVNDGKGVMFISHVGLIYPSGFLPIVCGAFPLSNVVDVYQNSPIFRALRQARRLEGKCHVCEYREVCGGSRARAYAVTGNLFAQEPDCAYVPAAAQSG
jgi:AdoMet-dependent heme synthase